MAILSPLIVALTTIVVGALTLSIGQLLLRGALEPVLELRKLIGTIAFDLDFYANRFGPDTDREWRDIFRRHACSLREQINVIMYYWAFRLFFMLPPRKDVRRAASLLFGYSNRPSQLGAPELQREIEIRGLLGIST